MQQNAPFKLLNNLGYSSGALPETVSQQIDLSNKGKVGQDSIVQ